MTSLTRSPRFFARLLEDHLAVVDRVRLELRVLNPSAAVLWLLLDDGWHDAGSLAGALRALMPEAGSGTEDMVSGTLREWSGLGWLDQAEGRFRLTHRQAVPVDPLCGRAETHPPDAPLPPHRVVSESALRLGRRVCKVVFCETGEPGFPVAIPRLRGLLSGLAGAGPAEEACEVRFLNAGTRCWVAGHEPAVSTADEGLALSLFIARIFRHFYEREGQFAYVHSAAVAGEREALLLPGPSGAGKSTLTAYLAATGWTYLGDDVVGLAREEHRGCFRVLPFPTAIGVKTGSWPLLKRYYPQLESLPDLCYADRRARFLALPRAAGDGRSRCALRAVVLPRYGENQVARLSPVNGVTALCELVKAGLRTVDAAHAGQIECLLDMLESVPCYRLSYSHLDDAARLLGGLLTPPCNSMQENRLTTGSAAF